MTASVTGRPDAAVTEFAKLVLQAKTTTQTHLSANTINAKN